MMKYISIFLSLSFALLNITGCGTSNDKPIVKDVQAVSITSSPVSIYATKNELDLNASVNYTDGTNADITQAARWETDFTYASLSYGKLTPKTNGDGNGSSIALDVTISYRTLRDTQNGLVTIVPLTALHIDDSNSSGSPSAGIDYTFKATADYGNGDNNISIAAGNSNQITWSVEGNATLVGVTDGIATISFTSGNATVSVTGFGDINDSKSYIVN